VPGALRVQAEAAAIKPGLRVEGVTASDQEENDEETPQGRHQGPEGLFKVEEGVEAGIVSAVADGAVEGIVELLDDGIGGSWAPGVPVDKLGGHGAYSGLGLREQTPARVGPSCSVGAAIPGTMAGGRLASGSEPGGGTDLALHQALEAQPILDREQHPIRISGVAGCWHH
jgi:hypothetical protein